MLVKQLSLTSDEYEKVIMQKKNTHIDRIRTGRRSTDAGVD